jgi:hypothetical protein
MQLDLVIPLTLISGATVSLFDVNHGEWQNVTAGSGSYTFTGSGSSHQYPLAAGTVYKLAASAAGYSPVVRDVTFTGDGQRQTVVLVKVEPEVFTFSMTNTAFITGNPSYKGELTATSISNCNNIKQKLESFGWKQAFATAGPDVTKADFNVNPASDDKTINDAILHFHTGHGAPPDITGHSYLVLLDQNNDGYNFYSNEVEGRWGGNNKWVILDSCYVMLDDTWGKALTSSHGIMGFKTQVDTPPGFTQRFLHYAIDNENTIYDSFRKTTYDLMKDTRVPKNPGDTEKTEKEIAAVYFKDKNQAKYDYLPGVKTGIYSGPNSGVFHREDWPCDEHYSEGN